MSINSFSFVTNDRAKREAAVLIKSIRQFYGLPIYILCDTPSYDYLNDFGFNNLIFKVEADPENLSETYKLISKIEDKNSFHNKAMIYKKMDCIDWAVQEAGNTFFTDADVVFVKKVDQDIDTRNELYLSPHNQFSRDKKNVIECNKTYGSMNAGYLWTRSLGFAERWKDIYLNRSKFYEQEGMIHFFEFFSVGLFNNDHNVGFWRFDKQWQKGKLMLNEGFNFENVKSFHYHNFKETYEHADKGLNMGYDLLYKKIAPHIPKEIQDFKNDL